ncbi:minor capsid protein [Paenibacillus apis]|uniref:Prophage head protein n=1 Tax=Paenibacillus apis TaxID=1792174 RepID=A0A919Y4Y9_9BACL|nr:minor capsid protein [Paenibacillus apis]GIO42483.1 prophage head protein [Paenibacillus apis]
MKTNEYWQKRSEQISSRQFRRADALEIRLNKQHSKSLKSIQRDIEAFYGRYAVNNEISFVDAKKQLDAGELKEFKMTLEEFTRKAKDNADGRWTKELNNVYYRTRVTRYEALLMQIRHEVELLTDAEYKELTSLLEDTYKDTYHRTLFEIQRGTGIGVSFAQIDKNALETVLNKKWAGSDYSSRIWDNKTKLLRELETNLSQAFIRGDSLGKTIRTVQQRMGVSNVNAARLVRTESAHIAAEATYEGYKASGVVKQYQFLATLDSRTSAVCQSMDNRIFPLSEKQVGVNYPPLHVNCRSTTVAYFDDGEDPGERIARDAEGNYYYVPDTMNYEEWHKKYVKGGDKL